MNKEQTYLSVIDTTNLDKKNQMMNSWGSSASSAQGQQSSKFVGSRIGPGEFEFMLVKLKPRYSYLVPFTFFVLIGSINFGYGLANYGPCTNILNAQMGWEGSQATLYSALITSMPMIGMPVGSFSTPAITARAS